MQNGGGGGLMCCPQGVLFHPARAMLPDLVTLQHEANQRRNG